MPCTASFPFNDAFSHITFHIADISQISDFQAINVNEKVLSVGKQSTVNM